MGRRGVRVLGARKRESEKGLRVRRECARKRKWEGKREANRGREAQWAAMIVGGESRRREGDAVSTMIVVVVVVAVRSSCRRRRVEGVSESGQRGQ